MPEQSNSELDRLIRNSHLQHFRSAAWRGATPVLHEQVAISFDTPDGVVRLRLPVSDAACMVDALSDFLARHAANLFPLEIPSLQMAPDSTANEPEQLAGLCGSPAADADEAQRCTLRVDVVSMQSVRAQLALLAKAAECSFQIRKALVDLIDGGAELTRVYIDGGSAAQAGDLWIRFELSDAVAALVPAFGAGDVDAL